MSSLKAVLFEEEWKVNFYSRRSRSVSVSSLCNKLSFCLPRKILSATSKGHISVPLVFTVSHGTLPQFFGNLPSHLLLSEFSAPFL